MAILRAIIIRRISELSFTCKNIYFLPKSAIMNTVIVYDKRIVKFSKCHNHLHPKNDDYLMMKLLSGSNLNNLPLCLLWSVDGVPFTDSLFYRPQRSCEGYVFTPVCHSVHRWGLASVHTGIHPPPPAGTPQAGTPRTGTSQSRHPPRSSHPRPPPNKRLLLRTVRILLECILVIF